jgi:hypothetical protein
MPQPDIRTARGPILAFMRWRDFQGLATTWDVIYLAPGFKNNQPLINHELCHLAQMNRDGKFKWILKYYGQLIRYGYWNAPYEVEARQAERNHS